MNKKMIALVLSVVMFILSACNPYSNCSTCNSATSGGQIMNNQNASQQVWDWLDQFDTTK